jgi:hypothetical protein
MRLVGFSARLAVVAAGVAGGLLVALTTLATL